MDKHEPTEQQFYFETCLHTIMYTLPYCPSFQLNAELLLICQQLYTTPTLETYIMLHLSLHFSLPPFIPPSLHPPLSFSPYLYVCVFMCVHDCVCVCVCVCVCSTYVCRDHTTSCVEYATNTTHGSHNLPSLSHLHVVRYIPSIHSSSRSTNCRWVYWEDLKQQKTNFQKKTQISLYRHAITVHALCHTLEYMHTVHIRSTEKHA